MTNQNYPVDIAVQDLDVKLTEYLPGFQKVSLDNIHQLDRDYLEKRDQREIPNTVGLIPDQKWRSAEDYLVFDNPEGTLAYIRPNPLAPQIYHALPFEIHFRTAAPQGFSPSQYFSLAVPQRNLQLLLKALHTRGDHSISAIVEMENSNVLQRLHHQLDEVEESDILPVRLFHSKYVSRTREEKGGHSDKEKGVEELSRAISSVIVATHLFSRKQIAYYEATAEVDNLFTESALIA
ncbi:MAG: hypothetical protein ABIG93_04600 [archaeon]|nr:hypothetical protein [Nanoarchaeota archaeon]